MDVGSISSQQAAAALVEAPAAVAVTDDTTLMLRYRDGDARAFELLYERHKGPLYRYLQRMCGRREVADDLFQEVWSKVIASRGRYEARAQFNTFLFRIAHNCAIDYFRRSVRTHENAAQDIDDVAEQIGGAEYERPDAALSEAQVRSDFRRALAELPAEQRDVFVLYEESGLTLEEIGRITGVAMETAKSRLRYAVGKLRTALHEHRPRHLEPSVQS
jgi:RNA polymerase sigma-70 factor (ECF subfamily)